MGKQNSRPEKEKNDRKYTLQKKLRREKRGIQLNQKLPTIEGPLKNEKNKKRIKQTKNKRTDGTVLIF